VVKLPREISPGAAARRSLLFDSLAALAILVAAVSAAAGIGVVGFVALPLAILLLAWYLIEGGVRRVRRRGRNAGSPPARRRSGLAGETSAAPDADDPRATGEQHHRELQS
jgi:hypothetical protein